jgi:glucuronate isomerase
MVVPDQIDGMQKQMNALSALGLLSRFVGMLTDSRSFCLIPDMNISAVFYAIYWR